MHFQNLCTKISVWQTMVPVAFWNQNDLIFTGFLLLFEGDNLAKYHHIFFIHFRQLWPNQESNFSVFLFEITFLTEQIHYDWVVRKLKFFKYFVANWLILWLVSQCVNLFWNCCGVRWSELLLESLRNYWIILAKYRPKKRQEKIEKSTRFPSL